MDAFIRSDVISLLSWGFITDHLYVASLRADLPELRHMFETVVAANTAYTRIKVWEVLAFDLSSYM